MNSSENKQNGLDILHEDEHLLVVNKPSGVLSQPGKTVDGSMATQVLDAYPQATGPMLVHRLDMDTSGLMLFAKSKQVHKHIQQQFEQRKITKRYSAILSKQLIGIGGRVLLPLRLDIDNRPTQVVCYQHGKHATTLWQLVATEATAIAETSATAGTSETAETAETAETTETAGTAGTTETTETAETTETTETGIGARVIFIPITGRTHQLRVHAADPQGLNAPIVGDRLYGVEQGRLMLHADRIGFWHPITCERVLVSSDAPF